jgi:hypothetical protein
VTKIIGIANSCKDCPHRHYYSSGTYECLKVAGPEYLAADGRIPAWCPLPDHPAKRIAELEALLVKANDAWLDMSSIAANGSDSARDAERLEWFSRHLSIERLNQYVRYVLQRGGDGDLSDIRTFIDAAIAASAEKEASIRAC